MASVYRRITANGYSPYAPGNLRRRSSCLAGCAETLFVGWVEPWRNPCGRGDGYRFAQRHPTTLQGWPGHTAMASVYRRITANGYSPYAPGRLRRRSSCLAGCAEALFVGWVEPAKPMRPWRWVSLRSPHPTTLQGWPGHTAMASVYRRITANGYSPYAPGNLRRRSGPCPR